ncbi:MAG: NADPH:quinone oxidoreductase family protein [Myxococcota bacterium]|nr:NADPH:quinone oxidoreductase family protein [Myxococcota bacterium]
MRAWQVVKAGEPRDALELKEGVELPPTGPGQVRMRVSAGAVGLPDVLLCRTTYGLTPPLPFTPGEEAVGVVTEVGEGAFSRVGERVMAVSAFYLGHGAMADECLAVGETALPVPDEMEDAEAAAFSIAYHTAWVALVRRGALQPGETLLVLGGAGGTGSAALQLGKALGARVIATAGGPEKVAFCEGLGADAVIDYRREDIAERVRELTAGQGAQVVYDPVGGDAFTSATKCIAREGRLLVIGFASGGWGEPDFYHVIHGNYSLLGVMPAGFGRDFTEHAQASLLDHWRAGRIRVPVDQRFPFVEAPDAFERVASGQVMGKTTVHL